MEAADAREIVIKRPGMTLSVDEDKSIVTYNPKAGLFVCFQIYAYAFDRTVVVVAKFAFN